MVLAPLGQARRGRGRVEQSLELGAQSLEFLIAEPWSPWPFPSSPPASRTRVRATGAAYLKVGCSFYAPATDGSGEAGQGDEGREDGRMHSPPWSLPGASQMPRCLVALGPTGLRGVLGLFPAPVWTDPDDPGKAGGPGGRQPPQRDEGRGEPLE
ncbi:hypothetical protein NDU88_005432 [Pleurodeles waltl]|uniref:Uncharacterized protein n=1 Tax=Pleurodeles waltl TaxID=8319 RepID=A0AAV7SLW0_PLEWA|nr:hypothetical protein NDU88_005432 [Pleurodeles waltl]